MYAAEWPCCHDPLRFSLGSDDLSPLARQPRQLPKRARALQGARCFRPAPRARRTRATDSFSCARAPSIFLPNSVGVSPTFYRIPSNHHVNDHLLLLLALTHVAHSTENHHLNPAPLLARSLSLCASFKLSLSLSLPALYQPSRSLSLSRSLRITFLELKNQFTSSV